MPFLDPDFANLTFLNTPLAFFGNQKKPDTLWLFLDFFQSKRFGSGKTLSELHIHYESLMKGVYNHAGCTEYCKNFTVALKMINVIGKKKRYDIVISGKENAFKECRRRV